MYRNLGNSNTELELLRAENALLKQENAALKALADKLRGLLHGICEYLERRWE